MVDENYDKLLDKIARISGNEKEEIDRRVTAKQAKLSGLISREGALQIISAELGVNLDNEKLKIDELVSGMRKVNLTGKVIKLSPVRTFVTKKGDAGKVVNLVIADDTSNIKVVLWDTNHIQLVETGAISEGSVIEIGNGAMRVNEIHLGSFSELKLSDLIFDKIITEKMTKEKNISELAVGDSAKVRAFIVQVFEPRFFQVCPECKKKVLPEDDGFKCNEHGKVAPEKRALVNIILDDGTGTIRTVLFHENLVPLGLTELENLERLSEQRQSLLGKEMNFSGNVKMNSYFNNMEFSADKVEEINVEKLIEIIGK